MIVAHLKVKVKVQVKVMHISPTNICETEVRCISSFAGVYAVFFFATFQNIIS